MIWKVQKMYQCWLIDVFMISHGGGGGYAWTI